LDKYNDSNVSLTLSNIREFRIKALGSFNESGFYISTPISRVSDIYDQILRRNSKNSKLNKTKITVFLLLFALMTPLGSYLQENFEFLKEIERYINALVIGIFLDVSTIILFESSKNHQFNLSKILVIIVGVIIAYLL
jgi:hypothetical protein